jgi:aminomethyltransferase
MTTRGRVLPYYVRQAPKEQGPTHPGGPNLSGTSDRGLTELWRVPCHQLAGTPKGNAVVIHWLISQVSGTEERGFCAPCYLCPFMFFLGWQRLTQAEDAKRILGGVYTVEENLKRTPLYEMHLKHGARMVPFGGWEMPVQYTGVIEEHKAVREQAGLFDVSHMGEFEVKGPQALDLIQLVSVNNAAKLAVGQIQYSLMCYENGTVVDDILVYRLGENHYWLVVNAGNIDKDWEWVNVCAKRAGLTNLELTNISGEIGQVAIQGPLAAKIMQPLVPNVVLDELKFYWAKTGVSVAGIRVPVLSRTGYTGEDGFEVYCKKEDAVAIWEALLEAGEDDGLVPAGLGARDTLRFEAKLPLYGHEINDQVTPLEAGLGFAVKLKKGTDFIGRAALEAQKANGLARKLVGFEMVDRGIPRQGYEIAKDGNVVGFVTTGTMSPTLQKNIGLGYVPAALGEVGTEFDVIIRGKAVKAKVVETPFYQPRYYR